MIEEIKPVIDKKIRMGMSIMVLDIARIVIKSKNDHDEEILDREIWKLAKKLSTNKTYIDYIKEGQKKLEERRKEIIFKAVEDLKAQNENITILKVRLITGLPKNFLYGEEIENYIEKLKQF